jgi:hypothetical protein
MWYISNFSYTNNNTNKVYTEYRADTELMRAVAENQTIKTYTRIDLSFGKVPQDANCIIV